MTLYDITRTISPTLAVFPGDTPFSARSLMSLQAGDPVNLLTLTLTAHCGTHADAVYHYSDTGIHPDQLPIERYLGRARVITVHRDQGPILPSDLSVQQLDGVRRVLLHTRYSSLPDDQWDGEFPYPSPMLIDWLSDQGVFLLGVDTPSVDHAQSRELPSHHQMLARDMLILENLMLRDVPDGDHELIALPLKIAGVCGTPVRAVLRR